MSVYESPKLLDEYLLFHYGRDEDVLPWPNSPRDALGFARRSVTELIDRDTVPKTARALDLGCAVGRSSYELASLCQEVIGIDYSQSFVDAAEAIRSSGSHTYRRLEEAQQATTLNAERPSGIDSERISFEKGDAMNLRNDLGSFDLVHAANLLCRLSDPQLLLNRLPTLVKSGGQLLLATPCTWLEEFTPREHWPEGSTLEWLRAKLAPHFTLEYQADLSFLIREHARKFQWSMALGTRWRRSS